MIDDLDLIDDKDCCGDCFKCPYAIWSEPRYCYDEPMVIDCRLEKNNG